MRTKLLIHIYLLTFRSGGCVGPGVFEEAGAAAARGVDDAINGGTHLVNTAPHPDGMKNSEKLTRDDLQLARQHPDPPGGPPTHPRDGSLHDTDLLGSMENTPPAPKVDTEEDWHRDAALFRLPRYAPEDEWRIKTWTIKQWERMRLPILRGVQIFFHVLAAPITLLLRPLKEVKPRPTSIPRHGIPPLPKGVWERIPSETSEGSWVNNLSKIKFKKDGPKSDLNEETNSLLKSVEQPEDWESQWKVPKYPPVLSHDPVVEQSYELGRIKREQGSQAFKEAFYKAMDQIFVRGLTEENAKILTQLLKSQKYLDLIGEYFDKATELTMLHEKMQAVVNQVVHDLGGERNARDLFRQIMNFYATKTLTASYHASPRTASIEKSEAVFLKSKDPTAYEMHLSPLLLFEEVRMEAGDNAGVHLKAASGYIGNQSRIDRLVLPAKKVEEYAQLSSEVHRLQNKLTRLRDWVQTLENSSFHPLDDLEKSFKSIVTFEKSQA